MEQKKKAQIGMEYLMIVGFLTFILIGTLAVAFYHSNSLRDMISSRQVDGMANKIVSSAESVFYSGEPSKITIVTNIPERITLIEIINNTIYVSFETSSGPNKVDFPSNVPITGTISSVSGLREIVLEAENTSVSINS